jgi:hypothetical protein
VQADATLPFRTECFAAIAAFWMLYYHDNLGVALVEAFRALSTKGSSWLAHPARYNDPEFASVLPNWGQPFRFDAETASEIISEHLKITEVITWDTPAVHLPDRAWPCSSAAVD